MPFRRWFAFQAAAGYSSLFNLVPNNLGDAIAQMRTSWSHYRLNELKVKIFSGTLPVSIYNAGYTAGADCALGIGFSAVDYTKFASTPSWSTATQLPIFSAGPANLGTSFSVAVADLRKTTVPWLETTSTGSESEAFQSAGVIWHGNYVSTATTAGFFCHVMIEGEIEFRDRIGYSVSTYLGRVDAAASEDEKQASAVANNDCEDPECYECLTPLTAVDAPHPLAVTQARPRAPQPNLARSSDAARPPSLDIAKASARSRL